MREAEAVSLGTCAVYEASSSVRNCEPVNTEQGEQFRAEVRARTRSDRRGSGRRALAMMMNVTTNAASRVARLNSSNGKFYCECVLADLPSGSRSDAYAAVYSDCDCRTHSRASGTCPAYTNNAGRVVGCNCRHCMALDLECSGGPVEPGTLVNRAGACERE